MGLQQAQEVKAAIQCAQFVLSRDHNCRMGVHYCGANQVPFRPQSINLPIPVESRHLGQRLWCAYQQARLLQSILANIYRSPQQPSYSMLQFGTNRCHRRRITRHDDFLQLLMV